LGGISPPKPPHGNGTVAPLGAGEISTREVGRRPGNPADTGH